MAKLNELVHFDQNFDFKIRRDINKKKKFYERYVYNSVGDWSLS